MRKIVGILFIVLAVISGINVARQLAAGEPDRQRGNEAYERGRSAAKVAPIFLLGLGLWMLRGSRPDFTPPPPRPISSSARPPTLPAGHPDLRGGQDTFATNPAQLQVSFGRWLAVHPVVPTIIAILILAGVGLLFVKYQVGIILLLSAGIVFWQNHREIKHKYFAGDVCPAEILSAAEGLVAVYTDLAANSAGPYPVIKIIKQPLHKMAEPPADGQRVAAVALYCGEASKAVWNDFDPEVINCVVTDPAEIERVLMSIPEDQWQTLGNGLTHIPEARIGLYPLWAQSAAAPASLPSFPWWKRTSAKVGLLLAGVCVLGFALLLVAPWLRSSATKNRSAHPAGFPRATAPNLPPSRQFPSGVSDNLGAYKVGRKIEANWAGGWIPGTIVEPFGRGMSYRVQLEDRRFPHPLVLSTNLLRPQ
jgi:hypothetical protein